VAYSRLSHKGAAVSNTLGSQLLVGGTTISLSSTPSGWPPAGAPFFVVIDPGTAKEEKVCVVYASGTTLTVVDEQVTSGWTSSVNGRGVDDTTAYQHESGAVVYPVFSAREANQANELVSSYTANGDLVVHGSSSFKKITAGTNAHVLQADSTVSDGGVKWGQVVTAGITDGAVTSAKIASAVAGNGLAGGAGSALSVNVDDSTIEINSDSLRVKDGGIVTAKLADDSVTAAKIGVLTNTTAKTDSFTLALGDENTTILCDKSTSMTVTIPLNSSVAFAVGTQISFVQLGEGQLVFEGAAGVTLNSDNSKKKIMVRYGVASLIKTATDTWVLFGQLTA